MWRFPPDRMFASRRVALARFAAIDERSARRAALMAPACSVRRNFAPGFNLATYTAPPGPETASRFGMALECEYLFVRHHQ